MGSWQAACANVLWFDLVEAARREGGVPDRASQIWQAGLAHLRLACRLATFVDL